jgi:hypothetical protein
MQVPRRAHGACVAVACEGIACAAGHQWRRCAGRIGRIAPDSGDVHVEVELLVAREQLVVGDRPVVADALERARAKVGWPHAGPLPAEVDRASADSVEHDRVDLGLGSLARVVLAPPPDVRIRIPLLPDEELELELVAGEVRGVLPASLLEAEDREAGFRELLRGHGTGGTGADHEDVGTSAGIGPRVYRLPSGQRLLTLGQEPFEVVVGLVREGRVRLLARIADALSHLDVHVVGARDELGERQERLGIVLLQRIDVRGSQSTLERRGEVGPGRERPLDPLPGRIRLARGRHPANGGDEGVGEVGQARIRHRQDCNPPLPRP